MTDVFTLGIIAFIVQPLTLGGVLACSQSASLRVHIGNIMLVSHVRWTL